MNKKILLTRLIEIKDGVDRVSNCGISGQEISGNILSREWEYYFNEHLCFWFSDHLQEWEYYSGCEIYPIFYKEKEDHVCIFDNTEDMWVGEYGRRRLELLDMMINYVEKQCDDS